jgi:hypothetical protein
MNMDLGYFLRFRMLAEDLTLKPKPEAAAPLVAISTTSKQYFDRQATKSQSLTTPRWPESHCDAGVFVVSDDEEGDEEEM